MCKTIIITVKNRSAVQESDGTNVQMPLPVCQEKPLKPQHHQSQDTIHVRCNIQIDQVSLINKVSQRPSPLCLLTYLTRQQSFLLFSVVMFLKCIF